jgi:NitT/TauT family transport system permease protein
VAWSGIYPALLFPGLPAIATEMAQAVASGEVAARAGYSLYLIGLGLIIGAALAFMAITGSMLFAGFAAIMEAAGGIFPPLPGIALLPIVLLWFGIGAKSIIVIIAHSVFWPLVINADIGFRSIQLDLIDSARVFGYDGLPLIIDVMFPSALPYVLAGGRIAWARAWRILVAAEMIFGACGTEGGLGWFIYQRRYFMDTPGVFAGVVVIILIGIAVDGLFALVERRTIEAWGVTLNRR